MTDYCFFAGFSLSCEHWEWGWGGGGRVSTNHSPTALFLFLSIFLIGGKSLHTTNPLFLGQDQSTVAQRSEMTVDERFLTSCVRARFPDKLPHHAWTA